MEDQSKNEPPSSLSDAMGRFSHVPGSTPSEKIQNAWAQLKAKHPPRVSQTVRASETPSSMEDIEASVPVSVPGTAAPLSVRADKDSVEHSHTAIPHVHRGPLLAPSDLAPGGHTHQPAMQTIQPSALTVSSAEEIPPGSVRLGPSEFAVTLPMDSRVKDDYDRVLTNGAPSIREFLGRINSNTQVSDSEVSLIRNSYDLR